jgi:uncharacterized protein (DUF2336 family)
LRLRRDAIFNPGRTQGRPLSHYSLLTELEAAVKTGTPEKRAETLRRVTSLFLDESSRLNEQQISVFDGVLFHLIQRIETKALIQLSESLAPIGNAPIQLIRRLSRHDKIAIAGPVLTQSNRLSESDLVDVAKYKGQGHLLAISGRALLPETVTDVLVDRGDAPVHHALAMNASASFSEFGFSSLVQKSASDEKLAEKLSLRIDIPSELLRQLLARATDQVRSRLLSSTSPEYREEIQRALASIANEVCREVISPRNYAHADNEVLELNRRGKLTEARLVEFIMERKHEEMTATLALFCGVKSNLIERLLKNINHEGLIVACRAAKLSWPAVRLILQSRFAHHSVSEQVLLEAKDAFLELSQAGAQRTMRFMQVHNVAKQAS